MCIFCIIKIYDMFCCGKLCTLVLLLFDFLIFVFINFKMIIFDILVHGSWFTEGLLPPTGHVRASGLRDTPGRTSRSLQRTKEYK